MNVFESATDLTQWVQSSKSSGKRVGLVPTMGYLHEGHLSLVKQCQSVADTVIVSIFVNPTQFGPNEDLEAYPRDLEGDLRQLKELGVDAVFAPNAQSMYQEKHSTYIDEESASLGLCGKSRPGHFKGVLTVCCKLFNITRCDVAVFGQKDAQQVTLIEKMVRELNMNLEIVRVAISREADGLARSSRNKYLSKHERKIAPELHKTLEFAKSMIEDAGNADQSGGAIKEQMHRRLKSVDGLQIDYLEVVDRETLQPVGTICSGFVLLAGAVYIGKTRLIDNLEA